MRKKNLALSFSLNNKQEVLLSKRQSSEVEEDEDLGLGIPNKTCITHRTTETLIELPTTPLHFSRFILLFFGHIKVHGNPDIARSSSG